MAKIDWSALLQEENAEDLWNGLYQLVSRHPAARSLRFNHDGASVISSLEIMADLSQELFLDLFQKCRFDYYVANVYTSDEIENELLYIEIPNLIGARLRKRYPESFRMARRVSSLLKSSSRFRKFTRTQGNGDLSAHLDVDLAMEDELKAESGKNSGPKKQRSGRMVDQVFGLREWPASKQLGDPGRFTDLAKEVPMRCRDTRVVGRTASSQLIISNKDLEDLIADILRAIDSPADVRSLRQIVLSKIPLHDYRTSSLDEVFSADGGGATLRRDAPDTRGTPEGELLRAEEHKRASRMAEDFLDTLRRSVNNNQRRYTRLIQTMWHIYFDPDSPSQIQIAEMLGISDSLVSDNRRLIEHELRKLSLTLELGHVFSERLRHLVQPRRVEPDQGYLAASIP